MLAQPGLGAPGSSATASAELDEEIQRIMAPLSQHIGEADDPADAVMDLSFLESVAKGIKEMQNRYGQKWQALKEQCNSANSMDQKPRDKGTALCEWHGKQFLVLLWKQEMTSMAKEDVAAWEARLAERIALLDAREKGISSREEKLEATLHSKNEELEALVQ